MLSDVPSSFCFLPSPTHYRGGHLTLHLCLLPGAAAVFGDVALHEKENMLGSKGSESPNLANVLGKVLKKKLQGVGLGSGRR